MQPVSDGEKNRTALDLFWIWFAANLGILGVVFGAMIVSFHEGFWGSVAIAALGSLSFALIGLLSVAGRDAGQPMMALSARVFGNRGNMLMALLNWVNLLGWEAVAVLTGTYAIQAALSPLVLVRCHWLMDVCGGLFLVVFLVLALYGYPIVVRLQKWVAYVFGVLTLVILIAFWAHGTSGAPVAAAAGGDWQGGVAAFTLILAGTSISWTMASSDYSRYLSRRVRSRSIVLAVTLGGGIPLFVLLLTGILLGERSSSLLTAANPIQALSAFLPLWMQIPYLIVVIGGLLAEAVLGFYSSGFNLLAMGVRIPRPRTAWIDFFVSFAALLFGLSHPTDFLGALEGFLSLMGVALAAWTGVFLMYEWRVKASEIKVPGAVRLDAFGAFAVATVIGLMFTSTPLLTGPYAKGIFAESNLGVVFALVVAGGLYYVLGHFRFRLEAHSE